MRILIPILLLLSLDCLGQIPAFTQPEPVPKPDYEALCAVFDGTNDWCRLTSSGPTGLADGKQFTCQAWVRFLGNNGVQQNIFCIATSGQATRLQFYKNATNTMQVFGRNAANTTILNVSGSTPVVDSNGWTHVMWCIDMADSNKFRLYVNGVADTFNQIAWTDDTIDCVNASATYTLGGSGNTTPGAKLTGALCLPWFDDSYTTNLTAFRGWNGKAIYPGDDGSLPTGSQPVFYLRGHGSAINVNSGTGGNLTTSGTLQNLAGPNGGVTYPEGSWVWCTPEAVGLSSANITAFQTHVTNTAGGVVIRNGMMAAHWGTPDWHEQQASLSKIMFGLMTMFAMKETLIASPDVLVTNYVAGLMGVDTNMTLRHAGNMLSGYTLPEGPGERWGYNDYGIQLFRLSLEDVFSSTDWDAVVKHTSRLGQLGFEDGIIMTNTTARLWASMRDLARVGWFVRNRGTWNGTNFLDSKFFTSYIRPQVPAGTQRTAGGTPDDYLGIGTYGGGNDQDGTGPGVYGWAWWFNGPGKLLWPDAPASAFMSHGYWTEFNLLILPEQDVVAAWIGPDAWTEESEEIALAHQNTAIQLLMPQ